MVRRVSGIVTLALLGALALSSFALAEQVTLRLWTSARTHRDAWNFIAERYTREVNPNLNVEVRYISGLANFAEQLTIAFTVNDAPDLVDLNQGWVSHFLQMDPVPFVDLRPRLEAGGYMDKIVQSRLALYSWQGKVYGIEHALTPVVMFYRRDLFDRFGFAPQVETWDEFVALGRKINRDEHAMATPGLWEVLLRQRGGDLFDAEGNVTADTEDSIKLYEWILEQEDLGVLSDPPPGEDFYEASAHDFFLTNIGADWMGGFIERALPEQAGNWGVLPLPGWTDCPDCPRTSVSGGTGLAITYTTEHLEEAWKFMEHSMLTVQGAVTRFQMIQLFPTFIPAFQDPALREPEPYFAGQRIGELYAKVGIDAPWQYQSPYRRDWYTAFAAYRDDIAKRNIPVGQALREASDQVRAMIAQGRTE